MRSFQLQSICKCLLDPSIILLMLFQSRLQLQPWSRPRSWFSNYIIHIANAIELSLLSPSLQSIRYYRNTPCIGLHIKQQIVNDGKIKEYESRNEWEAKDENGNLTR
ncbi:hypothetical protein LOAG_08246 [Loa loa]|uniref:Uncharacterized protein n=1 Tax=Loa loa TaxID=7209 RepID=A0A1S0TVM5_LOALO|nr:hypothetical protein LOAG_08246 [Loa loa]EFO20242.1 hypothetical protein LOAG_08246 [Loa loa]